MVRGVFWGAQLADPAEIVPLWPQGVPGENARALDEEVHERSTSADFRDRVATGIGEPQIAVFRPREPDGSAVLIVPGGNYVRVTIDNEGYETARRLTQAGVTCFVLRYRLPFEGWPLDVPLADAQRAMRLIRTRAPHLGVDPARVGVMGFSAGGHLAGQLATRYNDVIFAPADDAAAASAKPAFQALLYPVLTMKRPHAFEGAVEALLGAGADEDMRARYSIETLVDARTPPAFLCVAQDDDVIAASSVRDYYDALNAAHVPAELHLFEKGGHGFGLRLAQGLPVALWPELFLAWGRAAGFFGG